MRAAVLQGNVVVNVLEVSSIGAGQIDGTGANIGDTWNGSAFVAPVVPASVPAVISPRQFRQALTFYTFRTNVDNTIAASDQDTKDWYQFATQFERNHPKVLSMAQAMGYTSAQLDQVWTYGAGL